MATVEVPRTANHVFTAFSLLGFVLVTIPFPWHLEAWNTGTCLFMFWTGLGCLNYGVNSIIWDTHAINIAPVWCDISSRIVWAHSVGVTAASLCINRRLYQIASVQTVTVSKAQRRRAIYEDLAIGLGIPLIQLPLAYITQGRRFNLYEQIGCWPNIYNSVFASIFVFSWPVAIGLVSAFYCVRTIIAFYKRRATFKELLSASNNLTSHRYFRLMGLAAVDLLCATPLATYVMSQNIRNGVRPWRSWADTHSNFSHPRIFPAILWRANPLYVVTLERSRWLTVACAFVFFAFFGFADEARKNYRNAFVSFAKRLGYSTAGAGTGSTGNSSKTGFPGMGSFGKGFSSFGKGSIPVFIRQVTTRTTDGGLSSVTEKDSARISMSSVFDETKGKDFGTTTDTSVSSSSPEHSRSPSPLPIPPQPAVLAPPSHNADTPTVLQHSQDIV